MAKRSRFEVPFSPQKSQRHPPPSRRSARPVLGDTNRALINGGIVVIATLITTVFLLAISGQVYDSTNASLIAQSAPPLTGGITLTPSPQASAVASPSPSSSRSAASSSPSPQAPTPEIPPDDSEIQAAVDTRIANDSSLSGFGITTTVSEGKVILVGTAPSDAVKAKVEKLIRAVRGVKQVDNQIAVVVE